MGLMLPSPSQPAWQHNLAATPSMTVPGTTITASGTINVKGAYATLIASANFDVVGIKLMVVNSTTNAALRNMLIDIAIGSAGNEVVIASNLMMQQAAQWPFSSPGLFLPLKVPKGARISARCQANFASRTANIVAFLFGKGDGEPWQSFQGAETLGAVAATSKGFEHALGSTGAYSTWTNIGATSSRMFKAIMLVAQQGSDITQSQTVCYVDIGVNSVTLARYLVFIDQSEAVGPVLPEMPLFKRFPAGTQFMIRGTSPATPDDNYGFGIVGFY